VSKCQQEVSKFCLEGRLLNLELENRQIKYLHLATVDGEFEIKVGKQLRAIWDLHLLPGDLIQVVGKRKFESKSGKIKLKADLVMLGATDTPAASIPVKTKEKILVCQKSDCWKRGGKAVCQALIAGLSDRGLVEQVTIKETGCMKNCSAGPNLVMPDKTRYSRTKAAQIPQLLEQHFPG